MQVIFEDNHLIALNKPSGVPVQGDASADASLMDIARDYIKNKHLKPGNVFIGLLHRLDRPVSGVVLFAKTSKAASRISEQLRSRSVEKIYWALVHGKPTPASGTIASFLKSGEKKSGLVEKDQKDGKEAFLSYSTIRTKGEKSLLEIRLVTGRKHQIRAQMAGIGHPIEGDVKYGAPWGLKNGAIRLLAKSLTFKHPTREERITIEVPSPDWALKAGRKH
ncbi:MAG: RluA family pseudouridine synthase [Deltaproteobacteria bacterium]|nr:RluA family pseudouridine synthase [Deltaproteobacteria bacterium]